MYSFGIANPSYAKPQGGSIADTNNPDHILNSLLGATSNYDSVVDFTNASFAANPDSVSLTDPWKLAIRSADVANTTEINTLSDFRETKGYAIYIKASSTLNGFQNDAAPVLPPPPPPAPQPATASFSATTLPPSGSWDPQSNVTLWQNNLSIGSATASLVVIKFYASGTVVTGDITSLRLMIDGVQSGAASSTFTVGDLITFTPAGDLKPGTHLIQLVGNIVSGGGKQVSFSITNTSQVYLRDTQTAAIITPTVGGGVFAPLTSGTITINLPPPPATPVTTVALNATTLPNAPSSWDAGLTTTVWQNTLQVGLRAGSLNSIKFTASGTVAVNDIKNFHLFLDNTDLGNPVDAVDVNGKIIFSFTSPVNLSAGSRTLKLTADIVGGAGKTVRYGIGQATDLNITDGVNGAAVVPTQSGLPITQVYAASLTINYGVLTIIKASSSPTGIVSLNASGVTVARFNLNAVGEPLKIENLKIGFTSNDANVTQMRNVSVFLGGVQIGSTQSIATSTQFNFGSALIVQPGVPAFLELRSDIFDNDGVNDISVGDTLSFKLDTGSSNVYRTQSQNYISNSAVSANTITVGTANIVMSKYTAYANQTVTVPQTAYKLGEWRLTSGSSDGANLTMINLQYSGISGFSSFSDLYVVFNGKTTVSKPFGASSLSWAINEPVAPNTTISFALYGTLPATLSSGEFFSPVLSVDGTSQAGGDAITTGLVFGQTITIGNGKLTAALDASTPVSALAVGNTMPKVASYKFTAFNDAFTIVDLSGTTTDSSSIIELVFKDGATELGRQPFNATSFTKTGLNVVIAANTTKVIDVYASLGSVGTNAGATGGNVGIALTSYKYRNSNGIETATSSFSGNGVGLSLVANPMYVYKTKPTITNVALPTTVLSNGTQTIYQFSVTADAGGTVAWRNIKFNIATSSAMVTSPILYDSANQSTPLQNTTCFFSSFTTVICASTQDQEVSGSKTYVLKAIVSGAVVTSSISTSIASSGLGYAAPTSAPTVQGSSATFVWSDESIVPHTNQTIDWNNDYLVKNLPTDSLTMTK